MADQTATRELYSHAAVFVCPSIYEPFGIINLEAMACETAVVASAVGGIKEVVVDGETGFLVPLEQTKEGSFEPTKPRKIRARSRRAHQSANERSTTTRKIRQSRAQTRRRAVQLDVDRTKNESTL
jgi:glycosyltransferase involved in cell wall biosynthesis